MKRIVLILVLVFSFGMTVAHAEITQGTDNFTGGKTYSSGYKFKTDESIYFEKIIEGKSASYKIEFWAKALLGEKYLKSPIEIKIDEKAIQTIEVTEITSQQTDPFNKMAPVLIWNRIIMSQEIVDQIKVAKRVAIKVYKDKNYPDIVVLPPSVLAEWQQVINIEK